MFQKKYMTKLDFCLGECERIYKQSNVLMFNQIPYREQNNDQKLVSPFLLF